MENRRYWLLGLLAFATVGGIFPTVWAEDSQADSQSQSVLIETFTIELSTQALRAVGADIIDRSPAGLSVVQLSRALKEDKDGRVLSGLKLNVCSADDSICRGSISDKKQESYKITDESGVVWGDYSSERSLSVEYKRLNPKEIQIDYVYNESAPVASLEGHRPMLTCCNIKSRSLVQSGMPMIIGGSQALDKTRFVILLVTVDTPPTAVDKNTTMSMTLEQAQKTMASWVAETQKSVSKFNALEWGQLLPRDDGTMSIRCKYELTYFDKPDIEVLDQMIFFDKDGTVDSILHLQPPKNRDKK